MLMVRSPLAEKGTAAWIHVSEQRVDEHPHAAETHDLMI